MHVLTPVFDAIRQIFTWGRGKYGQLGHETAQSGDFPAAVKAFADHRIIQIACGGDHTIAINSDGRIFSVSIPLLLLDMSSSLSRFKSTWISRSTLVSTDGILALPVGTRFMGANRPWDQG